MENETFEKVTVKMEQEDIEQVIIKQEMDAYDEESSKETGDRVHFRSEEQCDDKNFIEDKGMSFQDSKQSNECNIGSDQIKKNVEHDKLLLYVSTEKATDAFSPKKVTSNDHESINGSATTDSSSSSGISGKTNQIENVTSEEVTVKLEKQEIEQVIIKQEVDPDTQELTDDRNNMLHFKEEIEYDNNGEKYEDFMDSDDCKIKNNIVEEEKHDELFASIKKSPEAFSPKKISYEKLTSNCEINDSFKTDSNSTTCELPHEVRHVSSNLLSLENCPSSDGCCVSSFSEKKKNNENKGPFPCPVCGKLYNRMYYLRKHKKIHSGVRFSCDTCDKSYSQMYMLKKHMNTHLGDRFRCQVCGKSFTQKYHLKIHMDIHTGDRFFCAICGKSFSQKHRLSTHMNVHEGNFPFSCETCGKSFTQKTHLNSHMNTHTGERPFSCDICGKLFTLKGILTRHVFRVHKMT